MTSRSPLTLTLAIVLVGLEAVALLGCAVGTILSFDTTRATMGITTAAFFLAYAAGLALCCRGLWGRVSWARSPVVLTQLIALGVAWGVRGSVWAAVPLALYAVVVLACLFSPASISVLEPDED